MINTVKALVRGAKATGQGICARCNGDFEPEEEELTHKDWSCLCPKCQKECLEAFIRKGVIPCSRPQKGSRR